MGLKKWEIEVHGSKLEILVPDAASMQAVDDLAGKVENDFLAWMLTSRKGVNIVLTAPGGASATAPAQYRTPERVEIVLTPAQARQLAQFLLDATEGMD